MLVDNLLFVRNWSYGGLCIGFSVGMTAIWGPDFFDVRDDQVGYKFEGRSW